MGACISSDIRKTSKPNQNQHIVMDLDYSSVPAFKHSSNSFVVGEKPSAIVTRPIPIDLAVKYRLSSAKFRSFGSNEDVFFESQPWLESDGDDEFYSVNGDSTPSFNSSASNTPVHKSLSATPFRPSEGVSVSYKLTLSPVKTRKSLSELFKENEEEDNANSNHGTSSSDEDTLKSSSTADEPKSDTSSKPHFSQHTERSQKSTHHCFPSIFSVHSPNMTKKTSVPAAK